MKAKHNILRIVRICLAAFFFVAVTLLFLGIDWRINQYLGWTAKLQFAPALMALNISVLVLLVVLTFIFGRIYCSVICPLGITQDLIAWLGKQKKIGRKNRYTYSPEKKGLRYTVLAIFLIGLIVGFAPVLTLLDPYAAFGRMAQSWTLNSITIVVAAITLVALVILAWRNGRTYCNTICPVGTILSFCARFSWLRVQIDEDKCNKCGRCSMNCKASAIDFKNGTVDYSRCVACGDCLDKCKHDALGYRSISCKSDSSCESVDTGKRAFLTGTALAVGSAAMAQAKIKVDGGLADLEEKKVPKRETPITPPGSISARNMARHCTACQLCVSACPNRVLRPSTDPLRFMQPELSFENGFCRSECTRCSQVCPTGAIKPIQPEDKPLIHIGHAVWIAENCIPVSNGDSCGLCARKCPEGAIIMVDYTTQDGRTVQVPAVDNERCIGCGKCEYLCPARPLSAIYVEGNVTHHYE